MSYKLSIIVNMNRDEKFTIIINPVAGKGAGKQAWETIQGLLEKKGNHYSSYLTENYSGTLAYCKKQIREGARHFVIIGGDGTLNEVANAIMSQEWIDTRDFTLLVIPVGKGNDWCRTFNIPFDALSAFEIIDKGNFMLQDVGKVSFYAGGEKQSRYFVNVAGMGFDAFVANRINQQKSKGSAITYLWNLLISLFNYKSTTIDLTCDGKKNSSLVFSMSIGICKYNGGGMMQLPNAIPNDGIFDLTIIKDMKKFELIRNIKRLYDGSLIEHPKVDALRAKKITLASKPPIQIELDGEICGESPVEFEILPRCLQVCVP
jgi:YegS/Rv2252/BmrU family lipid kinase